MEQTFKSTLFVGESIGAFAEFYFMLYSTSRKKIKLSFEDVYYCSDQTNIYDQIEIKRFKKLSVLHSEHI